MRQYVTEAVKRVTRVSIAEMRKRLERALPRVGEFLFPSEAETDESFQLEILRLSRRALYVIGGVEIGMPLIGLLADLLTQTTTEPTIERFLLLVFLCLGTATLVLARTKLGIRHARLVALLSTFLSAALLIWSEPLTAPNLREAVYLSYKDMMLVMVVGVATIPARPLHIFSLGIAIVGVCLVYAQGSSMLPDVVAGGVSFTLLCTVLSAVIYQRLSATHRSHQDAIRAERQLLLAEHTATMGRLAAAVCHEMNTPLGVLMSSVDTLWTGVSKYALASDEKKVRLLPAIESLHDTVQQSTNRLAELAGRMKRLTNLDQAEVQSVDVNDLLRDIASLAGPLSHDKLDLKLTLRPAPPVICQPQQLSAVLVNLISGDMEADERERQVLVSSSHGAGQVEVLIQSEGRSLSAEDLASFFEPRFQTTGDRIVAGNWSLFSARQTIREQGGEVRVASAGGKAMEIAITLPCQST